MDWLVVEAVGDGSGDITLREHGGLAVWRLTNDEARKLARRLITRADANEPLPEGAPRAAADGVAVKKI